MFLYLLARFLRLLSKFLPQRSLYVLAAIAGDLCYLFWRRARRNAEENMRLALGPEATRKQVDRAVRGNFRNYMRWCMEFIRGHEKFLGRINIKGLENVDTALAGGKGVIIVTLHMGSPEGACMTVAQQKYPVNILVDRVVNERVNRWIQKARTKFGTRIVAAKQEAMPSLLRSLNKNEVLALLIDCPHFGNVKVRFCGARAKVPGGAAALALRTGARIVPAAMIRTKGNRFTTFIEKPLDFKPSGEFSRDVQSLTQDIMAAMEEKVRAYPDQWFMFRRIWVES